MVISFFLNSVHSVITSAVAEPLSLSKSPGNEIHLPLPGGWN